MQSNNSEAPTIFYRLPRVREICGGVSSSTIWAWVKAGTFPKPIKLSANTTAWCANEVDAWARSRIAATRAHEVGKPISDSAARDYLTGD